MPKLPTAQDMQRVRKQATGALEQARTPLYAVLGAGDLASEAVRDYVAKARSQATDQNRDVQARANDMQVKLTELQNRLVEVRAQVRNRVHDLPEMRGRFEAGELRHALENYVKSLQDLYERLAARGQTRFDELRQQPQVQRTMHRVEDVADTTEARVGKLVEDARELTYDVLGRVSRRTRSAGETAAGRTEALAGDVAATVERVGDDVATTAEKASDDVATTAERVGGDVTAKVEKTSSDAAAAVDKAGDDVADATRSTTSAATGRPRPVRSSASTTTAATRKGTTHRKAGTKP